MFRRIGCVIPWRRGSSIKGMPIHSLRKLLGHQNLTTTQVYAQVYDETLYRQFREAMSHLDAIVVDDWPSVERSEPALVER